MKKQLQFQVLYKETLSEFEDFKMLDLSPANRRGRPLCSLQNIEQILLYPNRLKVTEAKRKDMMDLLPFIPPVNHPFFVELNSNEAADLNPMHSEGDVGNASSEED